MCGKPFRQGVMEYGCGQCMPCRINRRRLWTGRIMYETHLHSAASFWTFTYDEEHVPRDRSVSVREFQSLIKRIRYFAGVPVRFYGGGEYGDQTWRPHYHCGLFGLPPDSEAVKKAWTSGFSHSGDLTPESASYLASYCTKRMTSREDPRLAGRNPEFARMSLRPGIGAGFMASVATAVKKSGGILTEDGDVFGVGRAGNRLWPFGRYLQGRLRQELGFDASTPEGVKERVQRRRVSELSEVGGIEKREAKRSQSQAVAAGRVNSSKSRKKL